MEKPQEPVRFGDFVQSILQGSFSASFSSPNHLQILVTLYLDSCKHLLLHLPFHFVCNPNKYA